MMQRPSTIELNPELAEAWHLVLTQALHTINGLTIPQQYTFVEQIALNALVNSEKCLVLTSDLVQAGELRNRLTKWQAAEFCAVHQTESLDETLLLTSIEQTILKKKRPKVIAPTQFGHNFDKLERCRLRLNRLYQAVRKPVFGDLNWPELVGIYWSKRLQGARALLTISLAEERLEFNVKEYKMLLKLVQDAQDLGLPAQRLKHPLKQLHTNIFLHKEEQAAHRFCTEKLGAYQLRFETLGQKYNQRIEEYGRLLRHHFEQYVQAFLADTDQLLDQINGKISTYGPSFLDAKLGKIKWYGSLSSQGKSANSAYRQLIQDYETLKGKFERVRWFSFVWPTTEKIKSIDAVRTVLESFENTLKNSHFELGKFIQEEQLRLNSKSVLPELANKIRVAELEEEMDDLLAELNEAQLLNPILDHKMLTLSKRGHYLGQIKQQLADLQQNLPEFASFYAWQRFWLPLSTSEQNLIKALIENQVEEWPNAFETWYLYQVLLKSKDIDAPLKTPPLQEYHQLWTQFRAQLPEQIKYEWQQRRQALGLKLKKDKKSAEKIIRGELKAPILEAYTELFPLFVLHPNAFPEAWRNPSCTLFDWVIIWESSPEHHLDLEQFLKLGKRVVVINSGEVPAESIASDDRSEEGTLTDVDTANGAYWRSIKQELGAYFGKERVCENVDFKDFTIPMSLRSTQAGELEVAFIGDGFLSQKEATDFAWEYQKQLELQQAQGEIVPVWTAACWQNLEHECRKIAAHLISLEKQKSR